LVKKMIPQMDAMLVADETKSLFYEPINRLPETFSETDKKRLTRDYRKLIREQLIPSYKKLSYFLKTEYLAKARTSSGIGVTPEGVDQYNFLIRYHTTT